MLCFGKSSVCPLFNMTKKLVLTAFHPAFLAHGPKHVTIDTELVDISYIF
jgi:hypothetical protein